MTKCEEMMCAKKVWRNGRGRTARERRDMYIRAMRRKNIEEGWPSSWSKWNISNEIGTTFNFFGTLRMAKLYAHKIRTEFGLSTEVKDMETGIFVYETR